MIAYRYWSKTIPCFYVSDLKDKFGDWGYTTDISKAIDLSPYWQRRFASDCRAVGVPARFIMYNQVFSNAQTESTK
jgi:hypothetical protein